MPRKTNFEKALDKVLPNYLPEARKLAKQFKHIKTTYDKVAGAYVASSAGLDRFWAAGTTKREARKLFVESRESYIASELRAGRKPALPPETVFCRQCSHQSDRNPKQDGIATWRLVNGNSLHRIMVAYRCSHCNSNLMTTDPETYLTVTGAFSVTAQY